MDCDVMVFIITITTIHNHKKSSQVLNMDDHLPVFVLNGYENLTLFKVINAVLLISYFWINNITLAELFCFFLFS